MKEKRKKDNFNEEKARSYVNYLLEKDVKTYNKLIPEIQSLNSEEFEKLFKGEEYNYNVINKKEFKQLANKFDNFFKLNEYYEEDKYYPYIRDLWLKNICLEDLGKNDYTHKLKKFDIKYEEWSNDFKEKFVQLLLSTEQTRVYELKDKFKDQYNSYYQLIQTLNGLKQKFEDKPENKGYSDTCDKITNTIICPIFKTLLTLGFGAYANNIVKEASIIKGQNLIITDIVDELVSETSEYGLFEGRRINNKKKLAENMFNKLKEMICEDSNQTYALNLDLDDISKCKWYEFHPNNDGTLNLDYQVTAKNGEMLHYNSNLNLKELLETILKDNVCSLAILAASVINVGYSIYNFNQICEEYKNLVEIDKEFEEIKESFNSHKKLLEKLPDRITDAVDYINGIIKYIRDDYSHLNNHINNINQKIQKAEDIKFKSKIGMGVSIGLGLLSLGGSLLSIGQNLFTASVNGISTAGNAFALKKNYDSYELSKKVISELNEKLKRAIDLGNEINDFINKLIDELKGKENEIPKFCDFEIIDNKLESKEKEMPKFDDFEIIENNY